VRGSIGCFYSIKLLVVVAVSSAAETTTTTTCVACDSGSVDVDTPHRIVDTFYIVRPLLCSLCKSSQCVTYV